MQGIPTYNTPPAGRSNPGLPTGQLLETDPEWAYLYRLYNSGLNPNQLRYFQGQFENTRNRWDAAQVDNPDLKFLDYLNQNPFSQQWAGLAPSQRPGGQRGQFAPMTRWLR